jgi:hypothetical protein
VKRRRQRARCEDCRGRVRHGGRDGRHGQGRRGDTRRRR